MTVARQLREVRAVLVRDGWCQHHATNKQGKHCLLGAINEVAPEGRRWPIAKVLVARIPPQFLAVAAWNDHPGRTVEDVLSLIDDAIQHEEARR